MNLKLLVPGLKLKEIDNKSDFLKLVFQLIFSVIGGLALYIFSQMSTSIQNVEKSVNSLNIKMATSIKTSENIKEDVVELKETVKDNQKRIRELEKVEWKKD